MSILYAWGGGGGGGGGHFLCGHYKYMSPDLKKKKKLHSKTSISDEKYL